MSPEPTVLPAPGRRSPRLDAILLADAARERARAARDAATTLAALLGLPLWLIAGWPHIFSPHLRVLIATGWALAALIAVASVARERWWGRVRSRRIEALGPLPALRRERRGAGACAPAAEEED